MNLEKRQSAKTHISELKTHNGLEITNADEILKYQKLFYKNLPKLNEVALEELERPLTKEECFETLKLSSKGKCPGNDGFTVEFYLRFWSILGEEMVQSFNHALILGHLNITQRQGIISGKPI